MSIGVCGIVLDGIAIFGDRLLGQLVPFVEYALMVMTFG